MVGDRTDFSIERRSDQLGIFVVDRHGRIFEGPSFPMDREAEYIYYSRMGGFVPAETAIDTVLTNPIHYGAGGFEGIRLLRTPFGDGFVELPHNIARFVYSSLAFNLSLITDTIKLLEDPRVERVEHLQRTPQEFFAQSERALREGDEVKMGVEVFHRESGSERVTVPFRLKVKFDGVDRVFSLKEMEAAICSLAFLNGLVQESTFTPDELKIVYGGYFRPFFWVSGEDGLRVPTLVKKGDTLVDKPLYFAIATLPWGRYLDDEGYRKGLDVIIAPLPRIDESMPVAQKIAGDYVNSTRNINIAMKLGFGEILALNHDDEIVEGSAENIVMLMTNKRTGKLRAYCPPLSSNILAGTNRDRVIRIFQEGLIVQGKKVELVMEAPKKNFILRCLKGEMNWDVSAIVMMGTGVGLIHVKSITDNPALKDWIGCNELRSEETDPDPLVLKRLRETERRYTINKEERHAFVDELQKAYTKFVLAENGARITPAYCMDYEATARVFGLGLDEFADREFIRKFEAGYFRERINGVKQPDELNARTREVTAVLRKAVDLSIDRRVRGRIDLAALRR